MKRAKIVLIAHDIRSSHNVGSLLRTADGFGIDHVYLTGYTPYPASLSDQRLPHLAAKIDRAIAKTALGAEKNANWSHIEDLKSLLKELKSNDFIVAALEQTATSLPLSEFKTGKNVALLLGNEVDGVRQNLLEEVDICLEIPMFGKKESFNVSVAAAIGLYHLRNYC